MAEHWYPLAVPTMGPAEVAAVNGVLLSGHTTMGAKVAEFEEAFAATVGAGHAVMVNSGSSADLLVAFALVGDEQVDADQEVLVSAVTWPTHVWAWKMAGLRVRLVDVDPTTLNTTTATLGGALGRSERPGVVSLVHLMGVPCDMAPIRTFATGHRLLVTEDCCEALGATYRNRPVGTFGAAATWSFFFSHHISTMEGGMVTTNSAELADRLRCLRSHGWARHLDHLPHGLDRRYTFVDWGFNVRPTEVAAALGLVQLGRLDEFNEGRAANWDMFADALADQADVSLPRVPPAAGPSWFGLPLMVAPSAPYTRDRLAAHLEAHGVETRPILAGNLARQPVAAAGRFAAGPLPGADAVHDRGLYIGLHPTVNTDIPRVARIIAELSTLKAAV